MSIVIKGRPAQVVAAWGVLAAGEGAQRGLR